MAIHLHCSQHACQDKASILDAVVRLFPVNLSMLIATSIPTYENLQTIDFQQVFIDVAQYLGFKKPINRKNNVLRDIFWEEKDAGGLDLTHLAVTSINVSIKLCVARQRNAKEVIISEFFNNYHKIGLNFKNAMVAFIVQKNMQDWAS